MEEDGSEQRRNDAVLGRGGDARESVETMSCPFVAREIEGRGRGLIALRAIGAGETLCTFRSYEHTLYRSEAQRYPRYTKPQAPEICSSCLLFGPSLAEKCTGCPDSYCSAECRQLAQQRGHQLCCAGLQRLAAMKPGKYGDYELSTATYLLRAFARRWAEECAAPRGAA
jgi:hypothetical protein